MCDICVMNRVKERMLSRRDFFKGSASAAAATGAAALGAVVATPALADGHGGVVDMTHELHEGFPTFLGGQGLFYDKQFDFASDGFNLYHLTVDEHVGTHVDAPLHFSADGQSVAEIEEGSLVCPLVVIDIAARAAENPDTQVTPDDLAAWIAAHGDIPDGACVAMHSGWAPKAGDAAAFRNPDDAGVMHFPGFHIEATQMLLEQTGAVAMAVDTLSTDFGASADFATHYAWLPAGRYNIECLGGLDQVPAAGATLIVGAPKHRGGTGGPARIFALV
jgi:kynurenine formamidase